MECNIDLLFCCFYEDNLVTLNAKKDFGPLAFFGRQLDGETGPFGLDAFSQLVESRV